MGLHIYKVIALALLAPMSAFAQWTPEQKTIAAVAVAATLVDYGQTRWIAVNCPSRSNSCYETNPVLGRRPSLSRVNEYFSITPVIGYFVTDALPSEWRTRFLYSFTSVEIVITQRNYKLGYGINF